MSGKRDLGNGLDGFAEGPEGDTPMSFFDHLGELRIRMFRALLGVVVGFAISFVYIGDLLKLLRRPLEHAWANANLPGHPTLQVLEIQGALMVDLRVGIVAGIFIGAPIIFWQLWQFVSPGLYRHEKRFVIPFVALSVLMFLLGAAFAYLVVLPFAIQWLLEYPRGGLVSELMARYELVSSAEVAYQLELSNYVTGATRILLVFGIIFELPMLVAFLAKAGVVTHTLLLRFWRVAVLAIFVIAGFLTPPEPVTQLMMAVPMTLLYFLSVGVAYVLNPPSQHPPEPEPVADDGDDDDEEDAGRAG
jgi:sec-independent protein translocase protein TatC